MGNSFIAQLRTEMNCVGMDLHPGAEGTAHFQHAPTGVCCLHPPQNLGMKGRSQHMQNACWISHNECSYLRIITLIWWIMGWVMVFFSAGVDSTFWISHSDYQRSWVWGRFLSKHEGNEKSQGLGLSIICTDVCGCIYVYVWVHPQIYVYLVLEWSDWLPAKFPINVWYDLWKEKIVLFVFRLTIVLVTSIQINKVSCVHPDFKKWAVIQN